MNEEVRKNLRRNYLFNLLDGSFFGFGLAFSSFSTILPLFVATLTDSAIVIGLIPAIHNTGWQLPQLLMARRMAGLERYKPMTMLLAVHERLPFLGLAVLAWFLPRMDIQVALAITFLLLIWQGLGGGYAANPWQNLIGQIIPNDMRATFFGLQSAASSLMASIGAVLAGYILERANGWSGFGLCFLITGSLMMISYAMLGQTREPQRPVQSLPTVEAPFWSNVSEIIRRDRNFRWFLVTRMMSPFATMALSFFTVYAVKRLGMGEIEAGLITSVLFITQVAANPILGRVADRWSSKNVLALGTLCSGAGALLAALAPNLNWFYFVVFLAGIGSTAFWTIGMALSLEFGRDEERPTYIGLTNTLTAPFSILAPFLGGLLADASGYTATFFVAAVSALLTALVLWAFVRDPRSR